LSVLPNFVADDAASVDLARARGPRARGSSPVASLVSDTAHWIGACDLETLTDRQNLAQALILRLLTPRGSLAALAMDVRLEALRADRQAEDLRDARLCRAYILEVVAQEPASRTRRWPCPSTVEREDVSSFQFTLVVSRAAPAIPSACRWAWRYDVVPQQVARDRSLISFTTLTGGTVRETLDVPATGQTCRSSAQPAGAARIPPGRPVAGKDGKPLA
jgi:hypothetical protein